VRFLRQYAVLDFGGPPKTLPSRRRDDHHHADLTDIPVELRPQRLGRGPKRRVRPNLLSIDAGGGNDQESEENRAERAVLQHFSRSSQDGFRRIDYSGFVADVGEAAWIGLVLQ